MPRTVLLAFALALGAACAEPDPPAATPSSPVADAAPAPDAAPPAPDAAESPPSEDPDDEAAEPATPALLRLPLAARLPADALGVVALGSPVDLARRVGWTGLLDALGPTLASERDALRATFGHDLLDPATWSAFGVDPGRPAGLAMLSADPPLFALGVAVADRARLRTLLFALAAGVADIAERTDGSLTTLSADGLCVALHEDEGWLVIGDGLEPGEALHHARALAAADRDTGLLAGDTAGALVTGLGHGRELSAYIHLPAIFDAALRPLLGRDPARRIERQLLGAEALGDTERAEALRAEIAAARADWSERRGGRMAAGVMLRSYLSPFGGVALAVDVAPDAIELRFAQRLDPESAPGRVVRARPGPMMVRGAFDRPAAVLLEGAIDPAAAYDLLTLAAAATEARDALSAAGEATRAATGLDLRTGLVPLLAGDLGFAFAIDPTRTAGAAGPGELLSRLGFAAHVGLARPEAIGPALDRLAAQNDGEFTIEGHERWQLVIDEWTTVHIARIEKQLVAAFEPATLERLADPERRPLAEALAAGPRSVFEDRDGAWFALLDLAALGPLMLDHRPMGAPPPPEGADPAAVAALDTEIARAWREHREAEQREGRAMLSALGALSGTLNRSPRGLVGRVALHVGAADVSAAVADVARRLKTMQAADRTLWSERIGPLHDQRRALARPTTRAPAP